MVNVVCTTKITLTEEIFLVESSIRYNWQMLYTGKGDDGTTSLFGCKQRVSKNSSRVEALGALDELNSLLGVCKVRGEGRNWKLEGIAVHDVVHGIQENLFIIQAELAGSEKTLSEEKLKRAEALIADIEKELPPIKNFSVSGGTELSSLFDYARAVSRRAERRVIHTMDDAQGKMSEVSMKYLNRLSSLLFALARLSNAKEEVIDKNPTYE